MPDILVLDHPAHGIPASECVRAIEQRCPDREIVLAKSRTEELAHIPDVEICVGSSLHPDVFDAASRLRLFACKSAGVSHLDLRAFERRGISVTNGAGVHAPNIAEHVIGWMILITRRFDEAIRRNDRHEWRHFQSAGELNDARVCVVGLGAIGHAIVERLDGFGVETIGVRYTPEKGGPTDEVYGLDEIERALVGVDYLVLATPLSDQTDGLIGAREFNILPPNAVIINIARGRIIDTDALVDALRSNAINGAALDVTEPEPLPASHPLWRLGNAFITPHCSGHSPHYWERFADILAGNLEQIDETGSYENLANRVV